MVHHLAQGNKHFPKELSRLRAEIETVPIEYREQLRAVADNADRQYQEMEGAHAAVREMTADICLQAEHVAFSLAACRCESLARCDSR